MTLLQPPRLKAASRVEGTLPATTSSVLSITVQRFFANVLLSIGTTNINAPSFQTDSGAYLPSGGLPSVPANGYMNVFVGGELQPASRVSLTSIRLTIAGTSLSLIAVPVSLIVYTFTVVSSSSVQNDLSVQTDIYT
ncbi:hypothetical protein [Ectobacillus antri]|uniref:hypothetical protein n=1 Tax=Ectobacillus antri TaxID=2486280 RepID=UPI000F5B2768|nr:hypothetical protein [Ectobacillus antri]